MIQELPREECAKRLGVTIGTFDVLLFRAVRAFRKHFGEAVDERSMPDDDDILTGPVPEPDAEATAAERAHAKTFADIVDKTLHGRTPPAMSADDRALLEVATVIRAASGNVELSAGTQRSIVEDALRQAVGGRQRRSDRRWRDADLARPRAPLGAVDDRGGQRRSSLPPRSWCCGCARPVTARAPIAAAADPRTGRRVPADPLIGPIARDHAGDASSRIDTIFADRLDGFRERQLARGGKP